MKFEDVVDFPEERDAYMLIRNKLGYSEEEYLKLSYIERRELSLAYRTAKRLGLEQMNKLYDGYRDTNMFSSDGTYDLGTATLIIKEKIAILSLAKTKLKVTDSIDDFILKGNEETNKVWNKVREAYASEYRSVVPHRQYLVKPVDKQQVQNKFNLV